MSCSKRSHVSSSSSESMLIKQRTACEFKKKVVERLMDLNNQKKKNGNSVSKDRPIICSPMDRARAIQANLAPHFPSFLKLMPRSSVSGRNWLCIPRPFCDEHLPKQDGRIILLDDNNRRYYTEYVVERNALSVGWKRFSVTHKLLEGDVLVFQLIERCKFKIYIAKATRLTQVDVAATTLPNQDHFRHEHFDAVKTEPEEENSDVNKTRDKYIEHLAQKKGTIIPIRKSNCKRPSEYSLVSFKDLKGFKDFIIYVDGIILNSEIPTHCKAKYYELCKSQNMFLHENLVQGLNGKLAAEMISETIKIADAIRAVDFITGLDQMEGWDKTLKAFEDLGMAVGFLRVRIGELLSICHEYRADIELKRIEREEAKEEMRARIEKIDAEINALGAKYEGLGPVFNETACAPW